ncbi:MAG: CoA-binding protein, partial [Alphaproteobacteria bacterium]
MGTQSKKRGLYGIRELGRTLNPKTIAVAGASATAGSFANNTQINLRGFKGDLYYINPKYEEIDGTACYPTVADLPVAPDLVICCLPRPIVEEIVLACAEKGVGGMILFASGYKETAIPERIEAEKRLTEIAESENIRLIGPNSIGIYNVASGAAFTFTPGTARPGLEAGHLGIVAQSGALGTALAQCIETGVGISHFLPCGNSCDVDVCDLVNYLVEEPSTKAVTCLLEGVKDGARLIELGWRSIEHDTPVVWYKTGVGEISTQAALSHTGTLVGAAEAYDAAFRKTGMVAVANIEHLIETAQFLAKAGKPSTPGVGIIVGSGGSGIMCSDKAEEYGVSLPQPKGKTLEILEGIVPEFGSTANPIDVTAEALRNPDLFRNSVAAVLEDPEYGVLAMPQTVA